MSRNYNHLLSKFQQSRHKFIIITFIIYLEKTPLYSLHEKIPAFLLIKQKIINNGILKICSFFQLNLTYDVTKIKKKIQKKSNKNLDHQTFEMKKKSCRKFRLNQCRGACKIPTSIINKAYNFLSCVSNKKIPTYPKSTVLYFSRQFFLTTLINKNVQ